MADATDYSPHPPRLQVRKDMRDRYGVQFTLYDKIEVRPICPR